MTVMLVLGLAGCDVTPQSLGITGPGRGPSPPEMPDDATLQAPGVPTTGGNTNARQQFYGYN